MFKVSLSVKGWVRVDCMLIDHWIPRPVDVTDSLGNDYTSRAISEDWEY